MKHAAMGTMILCLAAAAAAATEYKPSELQAMLASGNMPATLPSTTETQAEKFPVCRALVNGLVGALTGNTYPTVLVADNPRLYAKTLWLKDEVWALSCSAADDKLTTTKSKYK